MYRSNVSFDVRATTKPIENNPKFFRKMNSLKAVWISNSECLKMWRLFHWFRLFFPKVSNTCDSSGTVLKQNAHGSYTLKFGRIYWAKALNTSEMYFEQTLGLLKRPDTDDWWTTMFRGSVSLKVSSKNLGKVTLLAIGVGLLSKRLLSGSLTRAACRSPMARGQQESPSTTCQVIKVWAWLFTIKFN